MQFFTEISIDGRAPLSSKLNKKQMRMGSGAYVNCLWSLDKRSDDTDKLVDSTLGIHLKTLRSD
jgi:hypothetical protein